MFKNNLIEIWDFYHGTNMAPKAYIITLTPKCQRIQKIIEKVNQIGFMAMIRG
jgi:hypothetical protein